MVQERQIPGVCPELNDATTTVSSSSPSTIKQSNKQTNKQTINQSIKQASKSNQIRSKQFKSNNQTINQSTNLSFNQPINQSINQSGKNPSDTQGIGSFCISFPKSQWKVATRLMRNLENLQHQEIIISTGIIGLGRAQ